ncbi:MAG: AAA family ATPase [Deltaproteobacteria bacterium]|nr:AAA family ATPase [Deltaproteobacteria bacterium]
MYCPSCNSEAPDGKKFCGECGSPLMPRCASCGAENPSRFKFCGDCGASLPTQSSSPVPSSKFQVSSPQPSFPNPQHPTPSTQSAGERRQLTVMFCDLVGSTALSTQLDPEELRDVVRTYQETCAEVIERYDGYIAQYLGDGILVYFGYPSAHEDDAARAVRAGLEILTAIAQLVPSPLVGEGQGEGGKNNAIHTPHPNLPPQGGKGRPRLQVRIGIHTGLVVVSEIGSSEKREMLALGETPNIAARLQALAEPDTLVISATTEHLVQGLFERQDLGPQTLKGISALLSVYRVMRESVAQSRFEATVNKGLTPLVGREEELGLLRRRWEQAKAGEGQVVLLSGEPGIGKSRLVEALKGHVRQGGATPIEFRCSPYHQNSAFYPIIDHLQRLLRFEREDSPEEKLHKLEVVLQRRGGVTPPLQSEIVTLFAALLSLPHPEGYPPLSLSPQKQKQKTQEALVTWLVEETERTTIYCIWEDLHWADPSTLEVLQLLIDQAPTTRLLTLLTFRPEFTSPWRLRAHITQLTLNRLGRQQVETMVEQVTKGNRLPTDVLQQIVSKTDGVPLFVEELTKSVIESGFDVGARRAVPLSLAIPATLQDSLMARLDRLGSAKAVAQLGSTLGREFNYELLQAVSPLDDETLQSGLRQLVDAELIYQRGLPPQASYIFKHALIQDTAYQSLLKSTRQQYHQQISRVLEERFPETKETQPELLAHHYTEAGLREQAIPHWFKAGQRASQRLANREAIGHLTKGLELLKTLPDTLERTQQELMLQITLGVPLIHLKGYAAPEVERTYTRARELCQQVGETPQLFSVLMGLWLFYTVRAEHQTARTLGEQLLRLARSVQDPALLLEAHHALGVALYSLGEITSAREHLERSIAFYDPQQHRFLAFLYGTDSGVVCRSYDALVLWLLGYPDQAVKRNNEALILAQELSHPFSLAHTLHLAAMLHQFRREAGAAQERAEATIRRGRSALPQGYPHCS